MEGYLNYLKKEYEKTEATVHLKTSGWDELAGRIGLLEVPKRTLWFRNFAIAFAVLLIFLTGTYQIAKAALPGDPLYSVKILSERIVQGTSGSNQIVIDHRAEEIIGLSKRQEVNTEELKQVVAAYKENVDQARESTDGKLSIGFQERLRRQHLEFDKISHEHPEIEDEIKDAQESSDHSESRSDD